MWVRAARAEDAAAIARVHVDSWRTTYRGTLADELLDSLSYSEREKQWRAAAGRSDRYLYVAEAEGAGVVGFAAAGPERLGDPTFKGELYALYILQEYQSKGAGRLLMGAAARHLRDAGYPSMLVWVLATNPARRFYEAMGGQEVRVQSLMLGDYTYDEVSYGWSDVETLSRAER